MANYNTNFLIQERLTLVLEYEKIIKKDPKRHFKRVKDLEKYSGHQRKVILSWYNSFIKSGRNPKSLLPKKRGPKNPHNKPPKELERIIVKIFRKLRLNPLELHFLLKEREIVNLNTGKTPSRAGIANILKRYPTFKIKSEEIIRYEKEDAGEMGHIDVKKLKNIKGQDKKKKKYLAGLEDDATRITYVEKISDKKAKTLALFLRRAAKWFQQRHGIIFKQILSDNGKEFTTHWKLGRENHSFEKEMKALGIIHKYTRAYRPQTNGKIEAFWKIIKREFLTRYFFKDWREFNLKLHQYMYNYNNKRKHGGINYLTPSEKLLKLKSGTELAELKENPKTENPKNKTNFQKLSADCRTVEKLSLNKNFNHFVTELVR